MPENTPSKAVPFSQKLLGVAAIAVLCACGSVSVWKNQSINNAEFSGTVDTSSIDTYYQTATGSYLSARYATESGDVDLALDHIDSAIDYQKGGEALLAQAYRLSVLAGDFEKALHYADRLPTGYTDTLVSPELLRAVIGIKDRQYDSAKRHVTNMDPEGVSTLFLPLLHGWLDHAQGKEPDIKKIDRLLKHSGEFRPLLQYQLALLLDSMGEAEKAKPLYDAIAEGGALSHRLVEVLTNFYHRQGDKEMVAELKEKYEAQYNMSLAAVSDKPVVDSINYGVAEIFYGMGSVLYSLNASVEAEILLRVALELEPDFAAVQFLIANLYEREERFEEAVELYSELDSHPAFALQSQIRAAYVYDDLDKMEKAVGILDRLHEKYPQQIDPLLSKGDLYRTHQDYEKAIEIYSRAIDLIETPSTGDWPVFYARGVSYERAGQWQNAEDDFLEALRLQPDQPDVLNYLGYSWLIQKRYISRAKEMIEKAMRARPQDAHIVDSMGWALYHLGDYKKALQYLEQAADLAPRDPTVNEHLGDVYWKLGYSLQARYQWERALLFDPQEAGQADGIKQKIASGLPAAEVPKTDLIAKGEQLKEAQEPKREEASALPSQSAQ